MIVAGLSEILTAEPRLGEVRKTRTETEFVFTLTPYIVLQTLKSTEPGGQVVYLDSDMMFFSSPKSILEQSDKYDVSITPHNFSDHMKSQSRYGVYNVGWVGFKNSAGGERCAHWWASQCLQWCHDRLEGGKFADQKYLELFQYVADSVNVTSAIGLNCAPWNASNRRFFRSRDTVVVDGEDLILYHFAKAKRVRSWCIATGLKRQGVIDAQGINRHVYRPYAKALAAVTRRYSIPPEWTLGRRSARQGAKQQRLQRDDNPGFIRLLAGLGSGQYVASLWAR